ncbi:hypothetical protein [uncultured Arcobacter sp.]|uniref:hypothetical protein n=1 Tax=uncultured Arcobacter sp. TaxID=165434 RepID=UPI002626B213|nr:hypothetical protein [uncultured Arcobacter sp.]
MKYFDIIGEITINGVTYDDLFEAYKVLNISDDLIEYYVMNDGDSLESVVYAKYGKAEYWWLLAILNNINDLVYDIPLDSETLIRSINNETQSLFSDSLEKNTKNYLIEYSLKLNDVALRSFIESYTSTELISLINDAIDNNFSTSFYREFMSYIYDIRHAENDDRRTLQIIKPDFFNQVIFDFVETNI